MESSPLYVTLERKIFTNPARTYWLFFAPIVRAGAERIMNT